MATGPHHRRRSAHAAVAVALLAVLASGITSGCSTFRPTGVLEPNIVPSATQIGSVRIARDFSFEDRGVSLSVPVDQSVYAGSVSAQKSVIFLGGTNPGDWVPAYYRAFVGEPHQTAFYESMARALHQVRDRERLDGSRYVELVTSMVQEMEYRTDPVNLAPKFPIETFGDGYGDCDDKTLVAAAILSRDGYDVAILVFTPEKHVALGIRAPGLDYKQTGYAYVEMTKPSIVGVPAETFAGGVTLTSQPVVIPIGQAKGAYTAGEQVTYIQSRLREVKTSLARMIEQISAYRNDLDERQASLQTAKHAAESAADPASQAAAVQRFNSVVAEYNAIVAKSNDLVRRSNELVDAERFVADHQMDRPKVYERLRSLTL